MVFIKRKIGATNLQFIYTGVGCVNGRWDEGTDGGGAVGNRHSGDILYALPGDVARPPCDLPDPLSVPARKLRVVRCPRVEHRRDNGLPSRNEYIVAVWLVLLG